MPRGGLELAEGRVAGGFGQAKGLYLLKLAGARAVVAAPVAMVPSLLVPGGVSAPRRIIWEAMACVVVSPMNTAKEAGGH